MDIAELVLLDIRQRLPFWETAIQNLDSTQSFILSKERSTSASGNRPKCFLPIMASPTTNIDSHIVLLIHNMIGLASPKGDAEAFLAFCDAGGTIVYYACECIKQQSDQVVSQ